MIVPVGFCGNCGERMTGTFCGNCGQQAERPGTWEDAATQSVEVVTPQAVMTDEMTPHHTAPTAASPPQSAPNNDQPWGALPSIPAGVRPHNSSAPTTAPTQPVRSRSAVPAWAIGVAAVVAIAVGVLVVWNQHWLGGGTKPVAVSTVTATVTADVPTPTDGSSDPTTDEPTGEATDEPTTEATTPTVTATKSPSELRREAFVTLEHLVADDRRLSPIRGQWVAQLASKSEGIVDRTQQAAPFTLPQILAEIMSLKDNPDYGPLVRVVHQGDWGTSTAGPKPMWVTVADIDVTARADVVSWCEGHFSQRGQALLNVCYPRQMTLK